METTTTPAPAQPPLYRYEMPNGQSPSWEASEFGDGWETLTVQDVRDLLAPLYEDIRTADVSDTTEGTGPDTRRVITFKQRMRTKGALAGPAPRPDASSLTATSLPATAPAADEHGAPPADPRPLQLWAAIAALPELVLACYQLAYDMQHRSLDELLATGDTLEFAMEQTEQEMSAATRLAARLIPAVARARHAA